MPKENTPKPKRRSFFKRLYDRRWKKIVTGILIFAVAALILIPYGIRYSATRLILANGGDAANIEDVDFNPFTGRVALTGLRVEVGQQQHLRIADAEVLVSLWPLLKKRIRIKKVWLNDTEMTIETLPEGQFRLGGVTAALLKGSQAKDPESSWGVGVRQVTIENTTLHLRMPDFQSSVHVKKWSIERAFTWLPEETAAVTFDGSINDSRLLINGQATPFAADRRAKAKVTLDGLDLEPFSRLLKETGTAVSGAVGLDADLIMTQNEDGSFAVNHEGSIFMDNIGFERANLKAAAGKFKYEGTIKASMPAKGDLPGKLDLNGQFTATGLTAETGGDRFDEDQLTWKGTLSADMNAKAKALKTVLEGELGSQKSKAFLSESNLTAEHAGLSWKGKVQALQSEAGTGILLDGALAIKAAQAAAETFNVLEDTLNWNGRVDLTLPEAAGTLSVKADGRLESGRLDFKMPVEKINARHETLQWEGVVEYGTDENIPRIDLDGSLSMDAARFESPDVVAAEKRVEWEGLLLAVLPQPEQQPGVRLDGRLNLGELDLVLSDSQLAILQDGLTWEGPLDYGNVPQQAPASRAGALRVKNLRVSDIEKTYVLMASKEINADAVRLVDSSGVSGNSLRISGLEVLKARRAGQPPPLVEAASISVQGFEADPQKRIAIEAVSIDSLSSLLERDAKGNWTFSDGLALLSPPRKKGPPGSTKAPPAKKSEMRISLGKIEIGGNSRVTFEDQSVTPAYRTQMALDTLMLEKFDTAKAGQKCPFKLKGKIGKYTDVNFDGTLLPFADRLTMDLQGEIDNLELPPLSPYIVKAIGYKFSSGQADADLQMSVQDGNMDGQTQFVFEQIRAQAVDDQTLERLEIEQTIPMETALSLLRDSRGDIKLKVPISGDIADPKFSVGDAINQALLKATTKASLTYLKYALGPYGIAIAAAEVAYMAANKAGGIRLEPVKFAAGASDIDPTARGYMEKLAKILKDRPESRIRVCGLAAQAIDSAGIQSGGASAEQAESPPEGGQAASGEEAEDDSAAVQGSAPATTGAVAPKAQLEALAKARADAIKDYLVNQHGIDADRILICHPEVDITAEGQPRAEILF